MPKKSTNELKATSHPASDLIIVSLPKAALTPASIELLKEEFTALGISSIVVPYNNNSPAPPRFERFRLGD